MEILKMNWVGPIVSAKVKVPFSIGVSFEDTTKSFWHGVEEQCCWGVLHYPWWNWIISDGNVISWNSSWIMVKKSGRWHLKYIHIVKSLNSVEIILRVERDAKHFGLDKLFFIAFGLYVDNLVNVECRRDMVVGFIMVCVEK